MVLVADSGATKADWALLDTGKEDEIVHTLGFNPVVHDPEIFAGEVERLRADLLPRAAPTHIYYYGAGCWDVRRKRPIVTSLQEAWPKAEIMVMHDLLAAARATCGSDPGIACILGTGSNTCLYDGTDVIDNVTNLGYMLGDEGSGSCLGRAFLKAYFYRELDDELKNAFESYITVDRATVIDQVYESEMPNTYLASFTRFMGEHQEHPLIQRIVFDNFAELIDRHVRKYRGHQELPIHFIGSIAHYFKPILLAVINSRNMNPGRFIQKPINELADFHRPR